MTGGEMICFRTQSERRVRTRTGHGIDRCLLCRHLTLGPDTKTLCSSPRPVAARGCGCPEQVCKDESLSPRPALLPKSRPASALLPAPRPSSFSSTSFSSSPTSFQNPFNPLLIRLTRLGDKMGRFRWRTCALVTRSSRRRRPVHGARRK